jgi:hypothetical protein
MIPLREFALQLGVEASCIEAEEIISIRWGDEKVFLPVETFPLYNGLYYVSLEEFIDLVGAEIHRIGEEIYIEIEPHVLTSLEANAEQVAVRFDTYTPYEIIETQTGRLHLRFYQCVLTTIPRQVTFTDGPLTSVLLTRATPRTADLILEFSTDAVPQITQFEAPDFYSMSFTFDHQAFSELQTEISPNLIYHEVETDLGKGSVKIRYLYVGDWRNHYRLIPAVPEDGIGSVTSLKDMARAHGARAAINANFFDTATNIPVGLLIANGTVLSSNYERRAALGIDLFGRLTFFHPTVSIYLRAGEDRIPIDDVNRPIRPDELVLYTENYRGTIMHGTTQLLCIIKIRADRVVSVQNTPYIIEDPTATLLIGGGEGRSRLTGITVGEEVNIEYTLDQGDLLITDVVSAGPLLISSGRDILDLEAESFQLDSHLVSDLAARSILATDWQGGLILLTVIKDQKSVGANFNDLLTILHDLPVKVKDAIAFDGGHSSSLVFKDGTTYREISSGGKVAVGLLLTPTER